MGDGEKGRRQATTLIDAVGAAEDDDDDDDGYPFLPSMLIARQSVAHTCFSDTRLHSGGINNAG